MHVSNRGSRSGLFASGLAVTVTVLVGAGLGFFVTVTLTVFVGAGRGGAVTSTVAVAVAVVVAVTVLPATGSAVVLPSPPEKSAPRMRPRIPAPIAMAGLDVSDRPLTGFDGWPGPCSGCG